MQLTGRMFVLAALIIAPHAEEITNPFLNPQEEDRKTTCLSAGLPEGISSFHEYCKTLQGMPESQFNKLFQVAEQITGSKDFPIRGCSFGCVVGNSPNAIYANRPRNAGSWTGKCFNSLDWDVVPTKASNIVSFRGVSNEREAYEAKLYVDEKSWDKATAQSGAPGVWALDYSDTPIQYGRSFRGYRDELRQVAPGVVLGKVFLKSRRTPYNFWSRDSRQAFHFVLFQVCNEDGEYTAYPKNRMLSIRQEGDEASSGEL